MGCHNLFVRVSTTNIISVSFFPPILRIAVRNVHVYSIDYNKSRGGLEIVLFLFFNYILYAVVYPVVSAVVVGGAGVWVGEVPVIRALKHSLHTQLRGENQMETVHLN